MTADQEPRGTGPGGDGGPFLPPIAAVLPITGWTAAGPIIVRPWSDFLDHPDDELEHRALARWVEQHDPTTVERDLGDRYPPYQFVVSVASPDDPSTRLYFLAHGYLVDDVFLPDIVVTEDLGDDNADWLRIAGRSRQP